MKNEYGDDIGNRLLRLARQSIEDKLKNENKLDLIDEKMLPGAFDNKRGTFVSLHKKGRLRGCIGNIDPVKTIYKSVIDNARHAAFNDSRFSPLTLEELDDTLIEVSVLTESVPLEYADAEDLVSKLRPGVDGVTIKKGYQSATFLPQVWKQLSDPKDFLKHLCMKAGLPSNEWRDNTVQVSVYQVQCFEEKT